MSTTTHRPTADAYIQNDFNPFGFGRLVYGQPNDVAGQLYTNVNESVLDETDYIASLYSDQAGSFSLFYDVTAGEYSNRTISNLAVKWWAARGADFVNQSVETFLKIGGSGYFADFTFISAVFPSTQTVTSNWALNPSTGLPWTIGDIENFRQAGTNSAGAIIYTGYNGQACGVCMIEMTVTWTAIKRRQRSRQQKLYVPRPRVTGGFSS